MSRLICARFGIVFGAGAAMYTGLAAQVAEQAVRVAAPVAVQAPAGEGARGGARGGAMPVDRVQQVPVGTGQISGTVTRLDTGRPVRGAMVQLSGSSNVPFARGGRAGARGEGGTITETLVVTRGGVAGASTPMTGLSLNRSAVTDEQGAFVFDRLPSGRFTLTASRNQFLQTAYGQRAPGRSGKTIVLKDGEHLNLAVPISRTGVITGVIFGDDGEPMPSAQVRAMQSVMNTGVRRLQTNSVAQTDDRGVYRLTGLQPGDFIVYATPSMNDWMQTDRTTAERAAFDAAYEAASRSSRAGGPPSMVAVNVPPPQSGPVNPPSYAPTYFPGNPSIAAATVVTIGPGEERANVDFRVLSARATDIRGTVNIGAGFPAMLRVSLVYRDPATLGPPFPTTNVNPDGSFVLRGVPPGEYFVYAQTSAQMQSVSEVVNGQTVFRTQQGSQDYPRLWAKAPVSVDGQSPVQVALQLQPGRSISGHVVFEMANPPNLATARLPVSLGQSLATAQQGMLMGTLPTAQVQPDGRFVLEGVMPGTYSLRAGLTKSAVVNGVDTLDFPLEFTGDQDIAGVVLTITDRSTELSGKLSEATGTPAYDYTIIVAADDPRYWGPGSRRIATGRPGAEGLYTFRNLPPGGYYLAAVTDLEQGGQYNPAFLKELAGAAMRVTIQEGGRMVQDIRVAR